jgi:hypothetical protein
MYIIYININIVYIYNPKNRGLFSKKIFQRLRMFSFSFSLPSSQLQHIAHGLEILLILDQRLAIVSLRRDGRRGAKMISPASRNQMGQPWEILNEGNGLLWDIA